MFLVKEYLYNLVTGKIKGPLGSLLRGMLFAFSWFYGLGVIILAGFYRLRPVHLGAKVISVGNITLGGTGKTTLVEYLSAKLSSHGHKVAVLSRGYKRDANRQGAQGMGDEPAMLAKKLPQVSVVVDKNRIKAAKTAIGAFGADTLILDDGLQQWKIFKNLEIVTIDVANPFGNYRLLPAGFLREPLFALKRADIFVLTQSSLGGNVEDSAAKLKRINSRALLVESRHEPVGFTPLDQPENILDLNLLKGKSVAVFSGIGNPEGFEDCVSGLGIKIERAYRFADHHNYTQKEVSAVIKTLSQNNLEAIITTAKDAVKIRELGIQHPALLVLEIKLIITKNETEFIRRLL